MEDCPDGFSESITRINGTNMFAAMCISQGEHVKIFIIYTCFTVCINTRNTFLSLKV